MIDTIGGAGSAEAGLAGVRRRDRDKKTHAGGGSAARFEPRFALHWSALDCAGRLLLSLLCTASSASHIPTPARRCL